MSSHAYLLNGSWFISKEVVESELSLGKGTLKTGVILQEEYNATIGTR